MTTFYCGAQQVPWLFQSDVPLFYAWPAIMKRRWHKLTQGPEDVMCHWALDSGGFSELRRFGKWTFTAEEFLDGIGRAFDAVGLPDFVCVMDWACGKPATDATGLSVQEHQERTVQSYLDLSAAAPDWPWAPVLQGVTVDDYHAHVSLHLEAGIDLRAVPRVAVGSVAARNADPAVGYLFRTLHADYGISMHGLGVNPPSVTYSEHLDSADSFAWMRTARFLFRPALTECEGHEPGCPALERVETMDKPDPRCTCEPDPDAEGELVGRPKPRHKVCSTCGRYAWWWCVQIQAWVDEQAQVRDATPTLFTPDDSYGATAAPEHGQKGDKSQHDFLSLKRNRGEAA